MKIRIFKFNWVTKIRLLFYPLIQSTNSDGVLRYKMDKKGRLYIYDIRLLR